MRLESVFHKADESSTFPHISRHGEGEEGRLLLPESTAAPGLGPPSVRREGMGDESPRAEHSAAAVTSASHVQTLLTDRQKNELAYKTPPMSLLKGTETFDWRIYPQPPHAQCSLLVT